jgi:hypothetical protein
MLLPIAGCIATCLLPLQFSNDLFLAVTLTAEKLRECHGIKLAVETIRALMTAAGLRAANAYAPSFIADSINVSASRHVATTMRIDRCVTMTIYGSSSHIVSGARSHNR